MQQRGPPPQRRQRTQQASGGRGGSRRHRCESAYRVTPREDRPPPPPPAARGSDEARRAGHGESNSEAPQRRQRSEQASGGRGGSRGHSARGRHLRATCLSWTSLSRRGARSLRLAPLQSACLHAPSRESVARRAEASCLPPPVRRPGASRAHCPVAADGACPQLRSAVRPRPSTAASAPRSAPARRTSRPRPNPGGLGASGARPGSLPRACRARPADAARDCPAAKQARRAVASALSAWRRSQLPPPSHGALRPTAPLGRAGPSVPHRLAPSALQ